MSKYNLDRLGSTRFEHLVQALFEKRFRVTGNLVQFGDGKDGGREATWTQPCSHVDYRRPENEDSDISKEWVFQAKYHDIGLRGWTVARAAVEAELENELQKVVHKHKVKCHKFVLVTNVPFSGVRNVGTRDLVANIISTWQDSVPEIEVWDAVDISRMLDADADTRTTYLDDILPGDLLRALMFNLGFEDARRRSAFAAFLSSTLRAEKAAKAEEAGDDPNLSLELVYVDLDLRLNLSQNGNLASILHDLPDEGFLTASNQFSRRQARIPASFAFLAAAHQNMLLRGGPGVGKSTVTQFLTLFHAARIVDPALSSRLLRRLRLTEGISTETLDAMATPYFPFRVELRRYAQWMLDPVRTGGDVFLADYLASRVREASGKELTSDDIFWLVHGNPTLLILDGLDEVPNQTVRERIFKELQIFLDRCTAENAKLQLILSTRPQGYRGEFDGFEPVEWDVLDLTREQFDAYSTDWIEARILSADDRADAKDRVAVAMKSPAVSQMAKTLLQATVMLTIVRQKLPIPQARHQLFTQYVRVIFNRESNKQMVQQHKEALEKLHELVGYRLLKKMESGTENATLGGDEFRGCVMQTIQDYGRDDLVLTIGQTVDAIVTQAKDRLCFLAGKGDKQEETDFVLQSFREFFAALYLAHHEAADPERAYVALMRRRNVWENVLQFYAAFQSPALQRTWINEADGQGIEGFPLSILLAITRLRRTLLGVLPEFVRPKNESISKAIQHVFAVDTRWTWPDVSFVAGQLNAFCSEARDVLNISAASISHHDHHTAHVELECAVAVCNGGDNTQAILESLVASPLHTVAILNIADRAKLPLDISKVGIEMLAKWSANRRDREPSVLLSSMTTNMAMELFLSDVPQLRGLWRESRSTAVETLLDQLTQCLAPSEAVIRLAGQYLSFPRYFVKTDLELARKIISNFPSDTTEDIRDYILALLTALVEDNFPSLELARNTEFKLKVRLQLNPQVTLLNQLGPAPEDARQFEPWKQSRALIRAALESARQDWFNDLAAVDGSIVTFLVHPDEWESLDCVIGSDRVLHFTSKHRDTARILWNFGDILGWRSEGLITFEQSVSLCELATTLLEIRGKHVLRTNSRWPLSFLADNLPVDAQQLTALLRRMLRCPDVPQQIVGFVMKASAMFDDVDLELLVACWERHGHTKSYWFGDDVRTSSEIVEKLVKDHGAIGAEIAAVLWVDHREGIINAAGLSGRISRVLVKYILTPDIKRREEMVHALIQQVPVATEVELWTDDTILRILKDGIEEAIIPHRLRQLSATASCEDRQVCWAQLASMVVNRLKYPRQTAVAALNLMLRFEELEFGPLADPDWQCE